MTRAIDILHAANEDSDEIEKAVRMHMECPSCKGGGGTVYYPECPCHYCGFTYADSFGVENIVSIIESIKEAEEEISKCKA